MIQLSKYRDFIKYWKLRSWVFLDCFQCSIWFQCLVIYFVYAAKRAFAYFTYNHVVWIEWSNLANDKVLSIDAHFWWKSKLFVWTLIFSWSFQLLCIDAFLRLSSFIEECLRCLVWLYLLDTSASWWTLRHNVILIINLVVNFNEF